MFDHKPYCLEICDTPGTETEDLPKRVEIYPGTDIVLICFSINARNSLQNVSSIWYPEIKQHLPYSPILLIATKIDLRNEGSIHTVSFEEGQQKANELNIPYLECSALTQEGLRALWQTAAKLFVEMTKTPKKKRNCIVM